MPVTTIPLVGNLTARGFAKTIGTSAKDQQYINCLFEVGVNPALGKKAVYVVKRPGSTTGSTIASGVQALISYSSYFTGMSCTSTAIYKGTTSLGTISGAVTSLNLADTVMSAQDVICFCDSTGKSGWYCFKDAVTTNFPTFSGDTHTNTTIDGIASTTGLYPGQLITGTGIQAGTRIATITSATAITVTIATTGTATVTITKEAIAKVIDSDYPNASVVSVAANNGYMFSATADGRIFNCTINAPNTVAAADYITADYSADALSYIFKFGDYIIAIGGNSLQYFQITGNSSGSVLSAVRSLNKYFTETMLAPIFVGGDAYMLAANTDTGESLYRMSSPTSMEPVNDQITGGIMGDLVLDSLGMARFSGNKRVLLLHDLTGDRTDILAYDPTSRMWSVFTLSAGMTSSYLGSFTKTGASTLFSWATGDTYTDSTVAYTMTIQTEPFVLNNGRPFTISMVELVADTQSSGTTAFTTYNDDYATPLTLPTFDMTAQNKVSRPCGYYPNHVIFKLEHSAATAFRAQALKVHWEPAG